MLFLVDDDTGPPIAQALLALKHEVILVRETFGAAVADATICRHAEDRGAIVVTRNHAHYLRLLGRRQAKPRGFKRAGFIALVDMRHELAVQRLRQFEPLWRLEFDLIAGSTDARLLIEIHAQRVTVLR